MKRVSTAALVLVAMLLGVAATAGQTYAADAAAAGDVASGLAVYQANCTACHGSAGNGRGPAAIALKPKPTDFTVAAWWVDKTDAQLVASVKSGRPGTSMTPFSALSDAELANVVAYLRTLGAAPAP